MKCAMLVIGVVSAGCASTALNPDALPGRGLDRSDAYVGGGDQEGGASRAPLTIDGEAVSWDELMPMLAEAAGGEAVREVALDRLLERECARRGIEVITAASASALAKERELLTRVLQGEGVANDEDEAARLLLQVRQARGLGDVRFAVLLRRSALLRYLVRDDVVITENALRAMYDLRYGPKRHVRLIVLPTLIEAQQAMARVQRGEAFSRIALALSIDSSAAAGGVVGPISRTDPAWPRGLREVAFAQRVGSMSAPIAVETGYAIVLVDREDAPKAPVFDDVRPQLAQALRIGEERRLSDRLARRLLSAADIEPHDAGLTWSWWALRRGSMGVR